jgi:ABC-type transport system substrate-binding protein
VAEVLNGAAGQISGLRVLDPHTLEVRLTAPIVYFLQKLAYPVAFVVDRNKVGNSGWEHDPNGTGPFYLQVWRDDDVIILDRNDAYYLEPARIAHLVYNLGPDLPLALYEQNEIDLVGVGGSSLERARDPNDPLSPDLRTGVSLCTSVIGLNNRIPPFDDRRVRQAFNYALDKELLVETFARGSALVASGVLPPGMPGYTGLNPGYPFDPGKARRLLEEAGYTNSKELGRLTYSTAGYGDPGGYVTAVITLWQEHLGVTIEPQVIDPFLYYDELYAGRVGNFYSSGWCADYPDPQNFLDVLYHSESQQNIGGFQDAAVDTLLQEARIEKEVTRRLHLYAEIERTIIESAPVVFASHDLSAVLVKPRVQGYVLTPIGVPQWHRVALVR